jgi:hypothetical protein
LKKIIYMALALAFALAAATPSTAGAEETDYSKLPGYVDFGAMGVFGDIESSVEVFLKGSLLVLVREAVKDEDPELSDMLANIQYIRVQVFPLDDVDSDQLMAKTKQMAQGLEKKGWEIVVRVREDDEQVYVYLLPGKKTNIEGLVVMVIEEDDEATFVNIVGDVDPAEIGRLGRTLDIDGMDIDFGTDSSKKDDKESKKSKRTHRR